MGKIAAIGRRQALRSLGAHLAQPLKNKQAYAGAISGRHPLSIEGVCPSTGNTLFDVLLPVASPRPHP